MNKQMTISKAVDLNTLTAEFKVKSPRVTGLSLNAGTELTVYDADDITNGDAELVVTNHVKPVIVPMKEQLRLAIEAENQLTPGMKSLLKRIVAELR